MRCAQPGCNREQIWAHIEGKPYCQYHYRANQNKGRKREVLKLLDHIELVSSKDARFAKALDFDLIDRVRALFTRGPGRPQTSLPASKAKRILDQLATNEEALTLLENLLAKSTKKK